MKETQIAKENVKVLEKDLDNKYWYLKGECKSHKASCEREKEFLENAWIKPKYSREKVHLSSFYIFDNRIKDLQNAIKIYEENGIK